MKHLATLATGTLFTLLSSAAFSADDWTAPYAEFAGGLASIDVPGFDGAITAEVTGGYRFNRFVGTALTYLHTSDFETAVSSGPAINLKGYYPSVSAYWAVTDSFDLYVSMGAFFWDMDIDDGQGQSFSDKGNDLMIGFGGIVAIGNNTTLSSSYKKFTVIDGTDLEYGAVSIRYSFY